MKSGLRITNTITFQTLFKYYPKLSGMTVRSYSIRTCNSQQQCSIVIDSMVACHQVWLYFAK